MIVVSINNGSVLWLGDILIIDNQLPQTMEEKVSSDDKSDNHLEASRSKVSPCFHRNWQQ